MRIAVMAYNLRAAGGLSVGKNVVTALARVADHHAYLLLMSGGVGYEEINKPTRCTAHCDHRTHGALGQMLFEMRTVPKLIRAYGPDLSWGLGNFGLRKQPAKQAIACVFAQTFTGWELSGRALLAQGLTPPGIAITGVKMVLDKEPELPKSTGYPPGPEDMANLTAQLERIRQTNVHLKSASV